MKIRVYFERLAVVVLAFSMLSCEKLLETDSSMKLKAEDHYSSVGEIYGAFLGLYASFTQIAEKTIILSELKGDLLEPTQNAPEDYWRIFRYEANESSTVSNAREYYNVVINCNDFLKRVIDYNQRIPGDIPENVYRGMVGQAICLKTWCLMTSAKLFGEAQFYNLAVTGDSESGMYTLKLAELPEFLMSYMQGGEDGVTAFNDLDWAVLLGNTNTTWPCRTLNSKALYGELCLWAGHYQEAVDNFISVLSPSATISRNLNGYGGSDWKKIYTDNANQSEMISILTYDADYRQENKLRYYFSYEQNNVYYFAPTQQAVSYFESEMLNRNNAFRLGDLRGSNVTYTKNGSVLMVKKYDLKENENEYANDAYIHIYRAGGIHLMLAEALCFLGDYDAAQALLDEGIVKDYYTNNGNKWKAPFENLFTAYSGGAKGLRGRVNLHPLQKADIFKDCLTGTDSLVSMSGRIADEVARELAYEGQRWFTLVRMAKHLERPEFLAERVAKKFGEGSSSGYEAVLRDENNWFIK